MQNFRPCSVLGMLLSIGGQGHGNWGARKVLEEKQDTIHHTQTQQLAREVRLRLAKSLSRSNDGLACSAFWGRNMVSLGLSSVLHGQGRDWQCLAKDFVTGAVCFNGSAPPRRH